uniref:Catalytic/ hydrolase n=1 Tax=Arundo donax TaxID=35708 RepID=A0A0A9GDY2_ARUDO
MEEALRVANVNPHKAVSFCSLTAQRQKLHSYLQHFFNLRSIMLLNEAFRDFLQIFFDDSVRNVQAGKRIGLHTVLVSS